MIIKIITVILAAVLLTACLPAKATKLPAGQKSDDSQSQPGLQPAANDPSNAPNFSGASGILSVVEGIDLSGQAEINIPGVTPPAFVPSNGTMAGQARGVMVVSGRLIPVADKEGKTVVGWRIVGELYNDSQQLFDNGQIMIGIGDRVLLAEPIQPGGFLPVRAQERMVYDTLVGEAFQSENITVGVRSATNANPFIRIDVENLKFKKTGGSVILSEESSMSEGSSESAAVQGQSSEDSPLKDTQNDGETAKFIVSGTVRNTSQKPVTGSIVRFWVVADNSDQNLATKGESFRGGISEEIIGVGTWQAAQDVLAVGQTREFSAEVNALTGADKEKLEAGEGLGLSAAAAAKPL